MKSYISGIETTNTVVRLQLCRHHLHVMLFEKMVLFTSKSVCKIRFMTELCNHYPILNLHIAGLRVDNSKSVILKSSNIVRGKRTKVPITEWLDTIEYLLERNKIYFKSSVRQHQTCQLQAKTFVPPIKLVQ